MKMTVTNGHFSVGRYLVGDRVVVGCPRDGYVDIVCEGDELPRILETGAGSPTRRVSAAEARLLPPLDPASRVFAVAVNYREHGAEAKTLPPIRPVIFYKAPSNFVAHGGVLNPNVGKTAKFDYEGEIGVVIGRVCKDATLETALDHVAGVCALDDGSARDLTRVSLGPPGPDAKTWPDWTAAKGLDGASALGPTIACGPDIVDALRARTLRISTRLNGEVVQDESMTEMIFSTEELIVALSSYMTLLPGDVIATGTPAGVGSARNRFLATGDDLQIQVSGLEPLCVKVG